MKVYYLPLCTSDLHGVRSRMPEFFPGLFSRAPFRRGMLEIFPGLFPRALFVPSLKIRLAPVTMINEYLFALHVSVPLGWFLASRRKYHPRNVSTLHYRMWMQCLRHDPTNACSFQSYRCVSLISKCSTCNLSVKALLPENPLLFSCFLSVNSEIAREVTMCKNAYHEFVSPRFVCHTRVVDDICVHGSS